MLTIIHAFDSKLFYVEAQYWLWVGLPVLVPRLGPWRVIPHLCWELLLTWLRSNFSLCIFDKRINGHATSAAKLPPTRCHLFLDVPSKPSFANTEHYRRNIQHLESESINTMKYLLIFRPFWLERFVDPLQTT